MRLSEVRCAGVAGVPDGTYDLPLDFVIVTGPAASGKTRFLEAILAAREKIAPSDARARFRDERWIAVGGDRARVVLTCVFDEREREPVFFPDAPVEAEAVFGRPREHDAPLAFALGSATVEYFPANRTLEPRKYDFVRSLPREAFERRLAAFGTHFDPRRPLAEHASSEQDAVIFAATAALVDLDRALVLVDRPELHLSAADPARLLGALRSLGEGAQVIMATAAPALVEAVPPEHVVRLGAGR